MENGNLSVEMCKFNPVLISVSGVSLAECFDNCQHEIGRVRSAEGQAVSGRSLGQFNTIYEKRCQGA